MLISIPVYIKGQKALSLLWLSDLTEVGSPMISRVNNDVTGGLTTGHWYTYQRRYTYQRDIHSITSPVHPTHISHT